MCTDLLSPFWVLADFLWVKAFVLNDKSALLLNLNSESGFPSKCMPTPTGSQFMLLKYLCYQIDTPL